MASLDVSEVRDVCHLLERGVSPDVLRELSRSELMAFRGILLIWHLQCEVIDSEWESPGARLLLP